MESWVIVTIILVIATCLVGVWGFMGQHWVECVYCHRRRYATALEHLIWVMGHRIFCNRHKMEKVKP